MSAPIVLYLGPSMIDGAPIVALASVGSSNVKTGAMIQTWIMRADSTPIEASHAGHDSSICGSCPRRHSLGGDCYVTVFQAPQSAYKAWVRAGSPGENWTDEGQIIRLQRDARAGGLRLGSYGDPAAVPHTVWADLIGAIAPRAVVGYTHQWSALREANRWQHYHLPREAWFRDHLMASCDTPADALTARAYGWRYFLAVPSDLPAERIPERTIECPATISERTCATCGACDGSKRGASKVSIFLREHGPRSSSKAKRAAGLAVVR